MEEYLRIHNLSLFDFWVFVGMFFFGLAILIYFWRRLIKEWKDTPNDVNIILLIVTAMMTGGIGTYMLMGLVHFIQMVLFLLNYRIA